MALLETPNGVTIIPNNGTNQSANGHTAADNDNAEVQRRRLTSDAEDDSFEYATDRESSVYNPTTIPLRAVMASAGGRNTRKSVDNENSPGKADLLNKGNQLGIPESRFSRWIPKDQREILEKQARLLANRTHLPKTPDLRPRTPTPTRVAMAAPLPTTGSSLKVPTDMYSVKVPTETEI